MKKLALILCFTAFTAFTANGQVSWDFDDGDAVADQSIANLANDPTLDRANGGAATMITSSVPSSGYAGASGTNNATAAAQPGGLDVSTSTYFEFTLTPDSGFYITATDLQLGSFATTSGPTTISLRSSVDSFTGDLSTTTQPTTFSWTLLDLPNFTVSGDPGVPVTFRIYGYGGTAAEEGNWRVDDINLTAVAVPEPSTYAMIGLGATLLVLIQRFRRQH